MTKLIFVPFAQEERRRKARGGLKMVKELNITKRKCPICGNTYVDLNADAVIRDWDTFDEVERIMYKLCPDLYTNWKKRPIHKGIKGG